MCARKGAILSGETPFAQRDGPPHQLELVEGGADGRHCISYQDNSVGSFSSKCGPHGDWIDVNPVNDHARGQTLLGEGCADDAGLAAGERRHGVKEMRYAAEAIGTGSHHGLGSRFAVADGNANADARQPPQKTIRQSFGRKRNQRAAGAGKVKDDGKRIALDVKAGDSILFGKYSGQEIKLDGEEYLIMREDEVLAVVDDSGAKKAKK